MAWRGPNGRGPLQEPHPSLVTLPWSPSSPSNCLRLPVDAASALSGGRRRAAEEQQDQQDQHQWGVFLVGPCPPLPDTTTTTTTSLNCLDRNITCNDTFTTSGPLELRNNSNDDAASNESNSSNASNTTYMTTAISFQIPINLTIRTELACGVKMGNATHFLMSVGNGTEEVQSFFKIRDETGSPPRSRPASVTFTDDDPDASQISGTIRVSIKKPEPLDVDYYRIYFQSEDGQIVSRDGVGPPWLAEMPATGFDFAVVLANDVPVPASAPRMVVVAGNSHGDAAFGRSMRIFDDAPKDPPKQSMHLVILLAFGLGVGFICCCTVSIMVCVRLRRCLRARRQLQQEREWKEARREQARKNRRSKEEEYCEITEPAIEEIWMLDPRPKPDEQDEVAIVAFAGDESACDGLCNAVFLSNDFDCGEYEFQVEAPVDEGVLGHRLVETWCHSAAEAIQLWHDEDGSETEVTGRLANEWEAMLLILRSKFQRFSPLAEALLQTGDTFLLHHNLVVGDDMLWADNGDGEGLNWLGIQLMLVRDEISGNNRWTKYLKGLIDIKCGEAWSAFQADKWKAVVRQAHAALEDALDGEYVDI